MKITIPQAATWGAIAAVSYTSTQLEYPRELCEIFTPENTSINTCKYQLVGITIVVAATAGAVLGVLGALTIRVCSFAHKRFANTGG
jgi:hypothetical protein